MTDTTTPVPVVDRDTWPAHRQRCRSPAANTLRDEMAVSGQRVLATSGQIPMADRNG